MMECNKVNLLTPVLSIVIWLKIITLMSTGVHSLGQPPPYIVKQPSTRVIIIQVAEEDYDIVEPFLIECEARGEPQPTYGWVKNGRDFNWQHYDYRMTQKPGSGTLIVTSPSYEDIGKYQCYAKNEWGIATSNFVFVRRAERISFEDEETISITAEEGKPFKIRCSLSDIWPKPRVCWILHNLHGESKQIDSPRITADPEGDLWFSNVTKDDRSQGFFYACTYSSLCGRGQLQKHGTRVLLEVAPTNRSTTYNHGFVYQYTTKRYTVALTGEDVRFWCIIGGTPLPEIKWSRKGGQIPAGRVLYENYGKTLRINHVGFGDEGIYDCEATNGLEWPTSFSFTLAVYAVPYFTVEPEIQRAAEGETVEFRCEASGKPLPEIQWTQNGVPLDESPSNPRRRLVDNNTIIIENLKKEDISNYGCRATNSFGYVYKDVYVNILSFRRNRSVEIEHVPPLPPSNDAVIWISSTMAMALAGALVLGLIMWRKYKYAANVIRNLTKEEVDEFYCGKKGRADGERECPLGDGPYNDSKRIRSEDLQIEDTILGEGQFGIVHKGIFLGECIAVKSSKSSADVEYFKAFLKEIKVMAYIGDHDNVVRFHGAVVDKIEERVCRAALELSPFGDLNGYLRTHSKEFSAESLDVLEANPDNVTAPAGLLNSSTLMSFCRQIAAGMDYLAQKQVIHGDLAARNVLVFENNMVKITDFGLSRKLYNCANYTKKNACPLPWRWMAIESLRFFDFSTKSDVWSFGVTMWEIFSLAQVPFSGVNWTTDFTDQLQSGFRLTKPQHCTPMIFGWMMKCWENQPEDRPAFAQCLGFLSMSNHISLSLENEANYYPIDRGDQMSV